MFERCLYFNTNALVRKINALWDDAFSAFNLSPAHAYLLRLVLKNPNMTQQQISDKLKLEKSTVTRFINALEKKGYLSRKRLSKDKREKIVIPTLKAKAIEKPLNDTGDDLYMQMKNIFGDEELSQFVSTSQSMAEQMIKEKNNALREHQNHQ